LTFENSCWSAIKSTTRACAKQLGSGVTTLAPLQACVAAQIGFEGAKQSPNR